MKRKIEEILDKRLSHDTGKYRVLVINQLADQLLTLFKKEMLKALPKEQHPKVIVKYPRLGELTLETKDFDRDIGFNQCISQIKKNIEKIK